jgi:MoaA/NifB/PqqE/SkfB family radical SAM enzyme
MIPTRLRNWLDANLKGVRHKTASNTTLMDFANRKAKVLRRISSYARLGWHMWRRGVPAVEIIRTQFPLVDPEPRRPVLVSVEFTNYCNLRCVYCNSPLNLRPHGCISREVFERLCQGVKQLGINRVRVVGNGEPTLHPEFPAFIRALAKATTYVSVLTNGQWNPSHETIEAMLDAPLGMVEVSVNGCDKQGYEQSRRGGDFERLIENLATLKCRRRTLRCPTITCVRLMLRPSERPVEKELTAFWKRHVDFVLPQYIFALKHSTYRDDVYMSAHWEHDSFPQCSGPFKALGVEWDGNVPLCSFSAQQIGYPGLVLGNIATESLGDLWHGSLMRQYRHGQQERDISKMPICKGCTACY